ncbi:hypothetical protein [Bradyrhizobium jicamae]|nr:hypothetical protein [Bradyrhizobium jicamae]
MHRHEGTIKDIAAAEGKSTQRIYQVAMEAGFPAPLYVVGKNKIYDMRQVARYFANRTDRRKTA